MITSQEDLETEIANILETPKRDFSIYPLTQPEVTGIIEFLVNEVNNEKTSEELSQVYLSVIKFLKTKIFYN